MKTNFIKTKNVKRFVSLMDNLQKAPANVPKMALVYGDYGLGKSQAIMWWVTNNDAIYVRCNHKISSRWLLSEIVKELDEEPCYFAQNLFEQIESKLKYNPKVIVVDEVSMLPKQMWDLLISHGIYVLATGDPGQLPPVDKTSDNGILNNPHVFLDEIMRQAQDSEIIRLSMWIREGKSINLFPCSNQQVMIVKPRDVVTGMYEWAD